MRFMTVVLLILAFCSTASIVIAGQDTRRDGNWWQEQSEDMKSCYMVGFFDGMKLGHKFSYWKYFKDDRSAAGKAVDAYDEYSTKYFSNVTSGQLVEGVDSFFKDYRNRRIMIDDAIWLVVNSIAGTPQDELEKMIVNWRKNAK